MLADRLYFPYNITVCTVTSQTTSPSCYLLKRVGSGYSLELQLNHSNSLILLVFMQHKGSAVTVHQRDAHNTSPLVVDNPLLFWGCSSAGGMGFMFPRLTTQLTRLCSILAYGSCCYFEHYASPVLLHKIIPKVRTISR